MELDGQQEKMSEFIAKLKILAKHVAVYVTTYRSFLSSQY